MSIGRPKKHIFPWICPCCKVEVTDRDAFYYHTKKNKLCPLSESYDMSAIEKKLKADVDLTLVPFEPMKGISPSNKAILEKFIESYDQEYAYALKKRITDIQGHMKDRLEFIVENSDYKNTELMSLKNFLNERIFDYSQKQEMVKDDLDKMLDECSLIIGNATFEKLIGNPPNYTQSMEKLVINHIRQRTLFQLENASELFVKAVLYTVKETKIFRAAQPMMEKFKMIEESLGSYLENTLKQSSFVREEGQMESQDMNFNVSDLLSDTTVDRTY